MGVLFNSASGQDPRYYEKKAKVERGISMTNAEFEASGLYDGYSGNAGTLSDSGT